MQSVFLTKRNGISQKYHMPKQNKFLKQLCNISPRLDHCNANLIHEQISLARGMSTIELADHIAEVCASLSAVTLSSSILAVVTALLAKSPATIVPSAILAEVI